MLAPVVPVLVVHDVKTAVPLANALVQGGLRAIEVTLRTAGALEAITAIANDVEGATVGAGTVMNQKQYEQAQTAGARFAVSPGSTPQLLAGAGQGDIPLLPGAVNASQSMMLWDRGYRYQKFFPAEAAGGIICIRALASVLPDVQFCPTGGIGPANAKDYLCLSNVICVGGSWVCPRDRIAAGDWDTICALANAAATLP